MVIGFTTTYAISAYHSLCLNCFHLLNPKAKFRKLFYLFKQILSSFSLVRIQFYLSQTSGKWVSVKTAITTKVVNSNPAHGEVYSIQHCVIKFVNDIRQVSGFHHQ